jgi:hypothetical protein
MTTEEMKDRHRQPANALMFSVALPQLKSVARDHGYALAVHGSMYRDLDLIAVPWVDGASEPSVLIEALRESIDGHIRDDCEWNPQPEHKPNGRLAWSIYTQYAKNGDGVTLGPYLDVSVTPRVKE